MHIVDYPVTTPLQLSVHIRSLRKAKGWSQRELGDRIGVGQTRIARIEADPASISVEQLMKLLAALGVKTVLRTTDAAPSPSGEHSW